MNRSISGIAGAMMDLKDKAGEAVVDSTRAVQDAAQKAGDLGNVGGQSLTALANDVNQLMPAIRKAGYSIAAVDVDAGLPPKIAIHCTTETELPEDQRAQLLQSLVGSRIATFAMKTLFQVSDVQKVLRLGSLRQSVIILELGLNPAVKIRYREPGVTVVA